MAAKLILAMLVAAAHGSAIHGGDYTSFSYGVSDPHTGDLKSQHETRVGDSVVGQYSLLDSDGTKRTVDYAADAHSGFNAVVRKDPALIVAPLARAAPAVIAHAAPVVVAVPVAHAAYADVSAPLTHDAYLSYATHATPLTVSSYSSSLAQADIASSLIEAGSLAHATNLLGDHGFGYNAHLKYSKWY